MTVIRAIAGYGKYSISRTTNELDPSSESPYLPLVITVIDCEAAIAEFFSLVKKIVKDKLSLVKL